MKLILTTLFICVFATANAQSKNELNSQPDTTKKLMTVETACGQCQFGLKGKGCTLAIRINGKAYFVEGTDIDSYGDAHAKDGFCNAIRKAQVQGEITNDKFKVSYFKVLKP
jgi:hypothetical protein